MEGSAFQELNKKSSSLICQKEELERQKKLLTKKKSAAIAKTAKTNSDSEFQTPNRPHIDLDEVSFILVNYYYCDKQVQSNLFISYTEV